MKNQENATDQKAKFGRTLILQTAHVGDSVSSLAAIKWFAERSQSTTVVVRKPFVSLFSDEPDVEFLGEGDSLAPEYDLILDFDSSSRSRKLVKSIKGSQKVGRVEGVWNKIRHSFIYSDLVKKDLGHIVEDYSALVRLFDGECDSTPRLTVSENEVLKEFRAQMGVKRVWGIHRTAARPHRSLPDELVDELIEKFEKRGEAVWLLDRYEDGVERFLNKGKAHVHHRELTLGELKEAMVLCDGLVACDSGPAHIASAVNCPSVILFGPTFAKTYRPRGSNQVIEKEFPCRPCNQNIPCPHEQRCLRTISAEEVLAELDHLS